MYFEGRASAWTHKQCSNVKSGIDLRATRDCSGSCSHISCFCLPSLVDVISLNTTMIHIKSCSHEQQHYLTPSPPTLHQYPLPSRTPPPNLIFILVADFSPSNHPLPTMLLAASSPTRSSSSSSTTTALGRFASLLLLQHAFPVACLALECDGVLAR